MCAQWMVLGLWIYGCLFPCPGFVCLCTFPFSFGSLLFPSSLSDSETSLAPYVASVFSFWVFFQLYRSFSPHICLTRRLHWLLMSPLFFPSGFSFSFIGHLSTLFPLPLPTPLTPPLATVVSDASSLYSFAPPGFPFGFSCLPSVSFGWPFSFFFFP